MTDIIKKNNLLDACLNINGDIFDEIKKPRRTTPTVAPTMDGVNSKIESHFANKYEKPYNSIDDELNLIRVQEHLKNGIDSNCHASVGKITPILVKEAINHLKNTRTDPVNDFTSDVLKKCTVRTWRKAIDVIQAIFYSWSR